MVWLISPIVNNYTKGNSFFSNLLPLPTIAVRVQATIDRRHFGPWANLENLAKDFPNRFKIDGSSVLLKGPVSIISDPNLCGKVIFRFVLFGFLAFGLTIHLPIFYLLNKREEAGSGKTPQFIPKTEVLVRAKKIVNIFLFAINLIVCIYIGKKLVPLFPPKHGIFFHDKLW
jgi:hypothetical protein